MEKFTDVNISNTEETFSGKIISLIVTTGGTDIYRIDLNGLLLDFIALCQRGRYNAMISRNGAQNVRGRIFITFLESLIYTLCFQKTQQKKIKAVNAQLKCNNCKWQLHVSAP
jgi:hypothetical protein